MRYRMKKYNLKDFFLFLTMLLQEVIKMKIFLIFMLFGIVVSFFLLCAFKINGNISKKERNL